MKNKLTIKELKEKRERLLEELRTVGPFISSSLSEIRTKCGKPNCRCGSGKKHLSYLLTRRERGKTKSIYVPKKLLKEVKKWNEEYHRIKEIIKEVTLIGEEIVKKYVKEKKQNLKHTRREYDSKKTS